MSTISTVVPVTRLRPGLQTCLLSVREAANFSFSPSETSLDNERIVRNACQDPKQAETVDALASRYGFKSVRCNLGSMVENWNECFSLAGGDFVHLLADDDWIYREFYVAADRVLKEFPDSIAVSTGYEVYDKGEATWENRVKRPNNILRIEHLEEGNPLVQSCVVMSRKAFDRVGGFRDIGFLDWDLYLRVMSHSWGPEEKWRLIPDYLCRKVEGDNQTKEQGREAFYQGALETILAHEGEGSSWRRSPIPWRMPARRIYSTNCLTEAVKLRDVNLFKLACELV